ncbi:MAG: IPT/TIG domain-containing protein [Acidobacteriota bacterium]|nr:IPT/TIG domain-containing protein [Acidobacteriota bacterium]
MPVLRSLEPLRVVHGGRLWVHGDGFPTPETSAADVTVGGVAARISFAAPTRLAVVVPEDLDGGDAPVKVSWAPGATLYARVARRLATGIHQVDNPVVDGAGRVYVTYSGSRGQQTPVSIFRVTPEGVREPFVHGLVNATSMVQGPEGQLYVSSRFEGRVYRVSPDGHYEVIGSDLGIATGLALAPEGSLFIGDRSGTIFRIDAQGRTDTVATLPGSMAAFHLAFGPDGWLYVSAPTLSTYDTLRRVHPDGRVEVLPWSFGRPQGLAFNAAGVLHVVEALAGSSGVYALRPGRAPELVVSGPGLVGLAFGADGALAVASNDALYVFEA